MVRTVAWRILYGLKTHPLVPALRLFEVDRAANADFVEIAEGKLGRRQLPSGRLLRECHGEGFVLVKITVRTAEVPFRQR